MNLIVTGYPGFLATHLLTHLRALGHDPYPVTRQAYDLRNPDHLDALLRHVGPPDIIFHLAANVGGIQYNLANPGAIFYDNVMMTTQLIHRAMLKGCGKFVMVGTVCSYPAYPPIPTREGHLWTGYPEESNGAYGVSKLVALVQLQAYHKQYGFNFAYPLLANLYGPGDSGFCEGSKSHLVPALIKKFIANPPEITMFGKGELTRDLLYVADAARALARFIEVDYCEPVNIATGQEVSKLRLVREIVELTGYEGSVIWDGKPDQGQLKRCYDAFSAKRALGWRAETGIREGLKQTIEWYRGTLSPKGTARRL